MENIEQIRNIRTLQDLHAALAAGCSPEYLLFWGHRKHKSGKIGKSCFSQWFETAFKHEGMLYPTAEHFMMAEKARLFGDDAIRAQVLQVSDPNSAKSLGRRVKGFDEALWQQHRDEIVFRANLYKFSQNPALRHFLLETGDAVLVEASPVDAIWGVGLAEDAPDARNPHAWRGLNLLGFALMQVRAELANS